MMTEIQNSLLQVSNDNIALRDRLEKALVELEEMRKKFDPLKKTFDEVLEEAMEYRERLRYHDINEWYYDKYEKANLL
jgi:archaellum component FlaC